jgi:hypothetical protein
LAIRFEEFADEQEGQQIIRPAFAAQDSLLVRNSAGSWG